MTRLVLSLLRLVAANRSAAQSAARGRSTGQYRRPVPAPAHAGYGHTRGYRHPEPARSRYAHSSAHSDGRYEYDDGHHNVDLDDMDADVDGRGPTAVYGSADDLGYQDDHWLGAGHSDDCGPLDDVAHAAYVGVGESSARAGMAAPDPVGSRAAGRSGASAGARGRGREGERHDSAGRGGVRAGASAGGAAGYPRRGRGASPTSAAHGARAGRSGSGGGGRSRTGGRAARGTGVLPPGEPYDTEPFATEPFATGPFGREAVPGGLPLSGTVHRPDRGGRGPGSGWGGGSGWEPGGRRPRRRWIPLRYKWIAALVILGLIFRRAVAWAVISALSAALHLVGVGIHLPSIKFGWPWQSVTSNSTTTTPVGPWVLQKIEGISKPALGRVNFNFVFTRKVSKSIGPWPCWYQSTFAAVGHASATVTLNPGSAWWAPETGHYRLRVLSAPQGGKPGHLAVQMMLPMPQLPESAHDVTIDDLPSKPIDVQHSWTYPGFGCGTLLKPQFDNSVLYAQAQQIAFYKSTHVPQVTKPLVAAAEAEAVQTVRDNFVQPTVNALGYTLDKFSIAWVSR